MPEECRKACEIKHLESAPRCASCAATQLISSRAVIPASLGRPMRTTRPRHWRLLLQPHHCLYTRGTDRWSGHRISAYLCHTTILIGLFFSQVTILFVLFVMLQWLKFQLQLSSCASLSLSQANPKCCGIRCTFQAALRQEGDARSPVMSRLVVSPLNSNTDPRWTISEPKNLISWLAALTSS